MKNYTYFFYVFLLFLKTWLFTFFWVVTHVFWNNVDRQSRRRQALRSRRTLSGRSSSSPSIETIQSAPSSAATSSDKNATVVLIIIVVVFVVCATPELILRLVSEAVALSVRRAHRSTEALASTAMGACPVFQQHFSVHFHWRLGSGAVGIGPTPFHDRRS